MYKHIYVYILGRWRTPWATRCSPSHGHSPPALRGGANRRFQLPRFVPQVAGLRRAPVQIKELKKAVSSRFKGPIGISIAWSLPKPYPQTSNLTPNLKPETRNPKIESLYPDPAPAIGWTQPSPPATRSELFTPFRPSIDFPWRVQSQTSLFKGNRPSREPGYSSHHIASGTVAWSPPTSVPLDLHY